MRTTTVDGAGDEAVVAGALPWLERRRVAMVVLLMVVLAGAALRFYGLGDRPLAMTRG